MRPWYAAGARQLLDLRQRGGAPNGPVVVSLVGGEFAQTVLYARPDMPVDGLDWRMLVNLDVWVWAGARASLDWLVATVWRIAQQRPRTLFLRFDAGNFVHDVDCGSGTHHPPFPGFLGAHDFFWAPVRTVETDIARRLTLALTAAHETRQFL